MTVAERIAWQKARLAERKPIPAPLRPDPVRREVKPSTFGQMVAAFIEDRTYDDVKRDRGLDSVKGPGDIHDVLAREQPDEYVRGLPGVKGTSYAEIGMQDLEMDAPVMKREESMLDKFVTSGEEEVHEEKAPVHEDSSRVHRVVVQVNDIPRPTPTVARPFSAPAPKPSPMGQMQRQMLDAIRAQRQGNLELMDGAK